MSDAFTAALEQSLGIEGGFSDDPADSGGATRFGIERWAEKRVTGMRGP